jgi:hypothetical protein
MLAVFAGSAWFLARMLRELGGDWWWFSREHLMAGDMLLASGVTGFLLTMMHDGAGRDDPALAYLATRPVGRRAVLARAVGFPLAAGAALFLVWIPLRDYRSAYLAWYPHRSWAEMLLQREPAQRRMSWNRNVTFSEDRRRAGIPGTSVDRFRAAGFRTWVWGWEHWIISPADRALSESRYRERLRSGRKLSAEDRQRHGEYVLGFEDYRRWREGHGPFTPRLAHVGWLTTLDVAPHWFVWTEWYLAFAVGVLLRAFMVFGPGGAAAGVRRALAVRNLLPVGVVTALFGARAVASLPERFWTARNFTFQRGVEFAFLHSAGVEIAAAAAVVAAVAGLLRGWARRDLA